MFCIFMVGPELNPKKIKIAWSEVCKLKAEGGLGLRSVVEANKVSYLKLEWKFSQPVLRYGWIGLDDT